MRISIDNRIRVSGATVEEDARLKALCEHDNPRVADLPRLEKELEKRRFDRRLFGQVARLRSEPSVIRTWKSDFGLSVAEHGSSIPLSLPRGVWAKSTLGGRSAVEDCRSQGDEALRRAVRDMRPSKEPRDYQREALGAMFDAEQGLLRQAAGSGKTFVLIAFAARVALPTLAIVPTQALLEQWIGVAISDFGLRAEDIGAIGGGAKSVRPFTVATVDSLAHGDCKLARELSRTFGVVLFDEVYSAAARTRFDVVDAFAARYRFGAGDDERRKDDLECLTYDAFGDVVASASRKSLEQAGYILPVRVRLVETGTLPPAWWTKLDPLSRSRRYGEIVRHLEDDPNRAALVAGLVRVASQQGQVLAFGHHVDHVDRMLADFSATVPEENTAAIAGRFLGGKAREKERQETTVGLLEGTVHAAFATYAALGKGINLPAVDRVVLATPIHGNRDGVNQVLARINRTAEGKQRPEAAVLYDEKIFGLSPVKAFSHGGREVVVERPNGEIIDARRYIEEREERERGESAGSFFKSLDR